MRRELQAARRLGPLTEGYQWIALTTIGLGILASLSEGIGISLLIPLLQSLDLETFQPAHSSAWIGFLERPLLRFSADHRLLIVSVAITVAILLKNVLAYANKALFSWFTQRVGHQLRSKIFSQLLNIHYTYLETKDSGALLNTLATESWQVSTALEMLVNIVVSICTLVVFALILFLLSWRLTLIVGLVTLLISAIGRRLTRRAKVLGQQGVQANSELAVLMCEGLMGMRTIRAFSREDYEQSRFDRSSNSVKTIFWRIELLYGMVDPLHESLSTFLVMAILVFSLLRDPTTLSAVLAFMFMLYRLQPQIKLIDLYRLKLVATEGAINAVMDFIDTQDKPYSVIGYRPFSGLHQSVIFKNVSFYYRKSDLPALQNLSLEIPSGKTTALVGPSGAGKSTLINLICRFYTATAGEIWVDGNRLNSIDLRAWREHIAIVNQDIHIFGTTIRKNIAYGRLEASDEDIITAAKQANAHEFIANLPLGYDTPVGDRGFRLSGGQRQRLALARAIVRDPDILILDEATNALDTLSEHLIQEALERFSCDRTVIVIAHRLSTVEQADKIVVLDKGEIVEQGTLSQLLSHKGLFSKLYQLQYRHALPHS